MREILGKCGFRCDLCPAHEKNIGSLEDKQKVSDGWFQYFGFRIPAEEIACTGCQGKGETLDSGCPVRPCAVEKGVENCAHCAEFECDTLKTRTDFIEELEPKLEGIPQEDHSRFIVPYKCKGRMLELWKALEQRNGK
jgi:hypothetical protein